MTLFDQGKKDYLNGVKIKSQHSYKAEYLRGYQFQQRLAKGNSTSWGSSPAYYNSSSDVKNWSLGRISKYGCRTKQRYL